MRNVMRALAFAGLWVFSTSGCGMGRAEPAASTTSGSAAGGESITNVQEQGVDEGGIVKMHGEHLVVLRRGRLFSVDLAGGAMRQISAVDVSAPGHAPEPRDTARQPPISRPTASWGPTSCWPTCWAWTTPRWPAWPGPARTW